MKKTLITLILAAFACANWAFASAETSANDTRSYLLCTPLAEGAAEVNASVAFMCSQAIAGGAVETNATAQEYAAKPLGDMFLGLVESTGVKALLSPDESLTDESGKKTASAFTQSWGRLIMFAICFALIYLAIAKQYEPLLLIPIAFGGLLANVPIAEIAGPNGLLGILYNMGIANNGIFPLLIFMGVGAMTDFGPLLANPKTALLGGAAQFGIFGTLVLAIVVGQYTDLNFTLRDAAAISIIGGADGPTSIYVASRLAPELLGAIAVAAYSYMALVPLIQPPIMRALTTQKEREIKMSQLREVSKLEKILFPISLVILCALFLPSAAPLVGSLCFGNLARECGVVERINDTLQNSLVNIVTIFLGLAVGSKLAADKFLIPETLAIVILGLLAFSFGTAAGVVMAKIMNRLSKDPINPLIGSAGVSAVPMAARVSQKEAQKANPHNFLLMHAMGPNVSGVIGSAVAAGVLLSLF